MEAVRVINHSMPIRRETTTEWFERNKEQILREFEEMDKGKKVKVDFDKFGHLIRVD